MIGMGLSLSRAEAGVTSVGDRKGRSDYEVFASVSDVMDQLRAARRLAADDPDPEVRKRASWFVRDVTWVIDMITRGAGCVVGPVWAVLRFFGKAVRGHGGAGRLGWICLDQRRSRQRVRCRRSCHLWRKQRRRRRLLFLQRHQRRSRSSWQAQRCGWCPVSMVSC